jgi:alkylation response protein AidB-like acyl-CoA dehydrogenase
MQCLMGTGFVSRFGTEEQKQCLLAPTIRGEKLGVVALTEPDAGSDLGAIKPTARWLVYRAAWLLGPGVRDMKLASMAKLFASEMANQLADGATRVFVSYGLAKEYPAQRYFRDARFLLLGGGTSEVLRAIMAPQMEL